MSNEPVKPGPLPPPVPQQVIGYATPANPAWHPPPPGPQPGDSTTQKVFDTVAGPNIRLKDNLIQLVCVIVGAVIGGVIGRFKGDQMGMLIGILAGLVGALVLSGLVIGILRFFGAVKK